MEIHYYKHLGMIYPGNSLWYKTGTWQHYDNLWLNHGGHQNEWKEMCDQQMENTGTGRLDMEN